MENFGSLIAFVQAAETRSFTLAGQRLGISSSAVGKAVARLEQELGVRLLHRSTRSINLTAEGRLFLERCHRVITEMELAREELTHATGEARGRLRIGMPLIGLYFMRDLTAFQRRYPKIELEVDFSDRLVNVIDEGFDAVIRIGDIEDSRLMMRRLGAYRHCLAASPAYLAAHGNPTAIAELSQHACLRYRYPTSGKLAVWPLVEGDLPVHPDLPQSATANTIDALLEMARADLGIALLPDFVAQADIAAGTLALVLDGHVKDRRELCVLWPSGRQQLPKVAAFVSFMAQSLRSRALNALETA
jgi:DNA-binding transcriptional LysR family regulator